MVNKELLTSLPYREIVHPEISEIRVYPTPEETAHASAEAILRVAQVNPKARITYATENTMIPVYENLARFVKESKVLFNDTEAFHLDEYVGLGPYHSDGFVNFLRKHVFIPLHIRKVNEMDGSAKSPAAEAARYDKLLSAAPIDLAILGIGPGSHIAFNEPGTPFAQRTHVAHLSDSTLTRDRKERGQNTPERALTQGIANIKDAQNILLVAYGKEKGIWLRHALSGKIGPDLPASALREVGQKVRIFIDEAAAYPLLIGADMQ